MIVYGLIFKHCITVDADGKKLCVAIFAVELAAAEAVETFRILHPGEIFETMTLDHYEDKHCYSIDHGADGRVDTEAVGNMVTMSDPQPPAVA